MNEFLHITPPPKMIRICDSLHVRSDQIASIQALDRTPDAFAELGVLSYPPRVVVKLSSGVEGCLNCETYEEALQRVAELSKEISEA